MNLKIFITGANGFIARNVIEQLSSKYNLVVPSHKELNLLDTSAVDKFFLRHKHFDVILHTAIVGGNRKVPNTPEIATVNLRMFFNVARNIKYFGRMIHLGSGIEYGKERALKKVKETDFDKYVPQNNFGFYKYLCGKFIENSQKIFNLRLFGVFGKYEDSSIQFISNAICKSIVGIPITINQNVYFDYLYVDDFVQILDYFLTHKAQYKSYNVGTGKSTDLLSIANKINNIAEHKVSVKIRSRGMANEYTCNNNRLIGEIGSFKFTNLDQALKELHQWYLSQKSKLKVRNFLHNHF